MSFIDPKSIANFIVSRLLKTLPEGGHSRRAVAETEIPIEGDDWYWADDNAKILEFLSLPTVWSAYPEAVSDIVAYVIGMCQGPLIFRRQAAPRFETNQNEGGKGHFLHSFLNVWCDLPKGEIQLGMRFHDGRTARNVTFGGNYIRFRHQTRTYTVDAEQGIFDTRIEPIEGGVRLSYTSRIEFKPGRFSSKTLHAGDLIYVCTIQANSMFVDFECAFAVNPTLEIADVALTFGCDRLSHNENGIRYERLAALGTASEPTSFAADRNLPVDVPLNGGARYWSITQSSHMSGFAAGIHSLPGDLSRVGALKGACDKHGRLHRVASEHLFKGVQTGTIRASERKTITSGGFYCDVRLYADALASQSRVAASARLATDFSISYDYGAEIYALACSLRTLQDPALPIDASYREAFKARIGQVLDVLFETYDRYFIEPGETDLSLIFSRSLSYVGYTHALLAPMADPERHAEALRRICAIIARFERINEDILGQPQSGFVMGTEVDALPYVDCHATCLLALVRGTEALGSSEWVDSIDRGLAAFCLDTQKFFFLGDQKIDVVCIDYLDAQGKRHKLETFWNFKSGLCLQLFGALRATPNAALQAVWTKHKLRLELLESFMRLRIEGSVRHHEDGVEILTSMLSAETNSETQPWVALGLIGKGAS